EVVPVLIEVQQPERSMRVRVIRIFVERGFVSLYRFLQLQLLRTASANSPTELCPAQRARLRRRLELRERLERPSLNLIHAPEHEVRLRRTRNDANGIPEHGLGVLESVGCRERLRQRRSESLILWGQRHGLLKLLDALVVLPVGLIREPQQPPRRERG